MADPFVDDMVAQRRTLLRQAFRYTRCPHAAEDIVAEAEMPAWKARDQFDQKRGTMLSWMGRIVHRCALMQFRKRKVRAEHKALEYQADEAVFDAAPGRLAAEPDLNPEKLDDRLLRAMSRCNPLFLEALLLSVGGLTNVEIAAKLGAPKGTIDFRIYCARRDIRALAGKL